MSYIRIQAQRVIIVKDPKVLIHDGKEGAGEFGRLMGSGNEGGGLEELLKRNSLQRER